MKDQHFGMGHPDQADGVPTQWTTGHGSAVLVLCDDRTWPPSPLRVTVLDPALDPNAPMWGDAGSGWLPAGVAWMGLLTAAGVPARGIHDPSAIDDAGLLVVGDPDATPEAVDRAHYARRPTLTGDPPDDPAAALAAVRDGLGALVRPDFRGVLLLRLDDPGAVVRRHLKGWAHDDVAPEAAMGGSA